MEPGLASWRAIGTWIEVLTVDPEAIGQAAEVVRAGLDELDRAASRFREDSELLQLHPGVNGPVSPVLAGALAAALRTARFSEGLVVPTLGAALAANGYDRDFSALVDRVMVDRPAAPAPADWRWLRVDPQSREVMLPTGAALDLGASAKAWAADLLAARASQATGSGVLVNLGGDLAVAGEPPAAGWRVSIDDATSDPDGRPVVLVASGGLATSSTALRTWTTAAGRAHHIIDPRTLRPAALVWRAVSVAAASAEIANAASTAAIILGDRAPAWLAARGLPARLRHTSGVVVHTPGWPVPEFESAA